MSWKALLVKLLSVLLRPGWRARCVGVPVCRLLRALAPRKNVARRNIAIALPDASDAQRRAVLSGTYDNLVWTGLEPIVPERVRRTPEIVRRWPTGAVGSRRSSGDPGEEASEGAEVWPARTTIVRPESGSAGEGCAGAGPAGQY